MIYCKELKDKQFDDKYALFKALKSNKDDIIKRKKENNKLTTSKELPTFEGVGTKKPFKTEKGYFYAIINSTNIMDSHNDVHLGSIWNKSAKEKNRKIFYVVDHDLSVNGLAVHKSDVEIQLHNSTFKDIGYDLDGETTLLVYKMPIESILHDKVAKIVASKEQMEQSVRMEYVTIKLCINSDNEEFEEEKADFDKYIGKVANKSEVLEQGYFFAVTEAKIVDEGSSVLKGSNSATTLIYHDDEEEEEENKNIEPLQDTQKVEPSNEDTQKNTIDYNYLLTNLKQK